LKKGTHHNQWKEGEKKNSIKKWGGSQSGGTDWWKRETSGLELRTKGKRYDADWGITETGTYSNKQNERARGKTKHEPGEKIQGKV